MDFEDMGLLRPEEILEELHVWGNRVSGLAELIAFTNVTLQLHRQLGDSKLIVSQYEQLLAEHMQELDELLKIHGLALQVSPQTIPLT